jgi:hypothetical protein
MTIGTDIAQAHPAVVQTGGMGAEMARGIDLSAATSGENHVGRRGIGCRRRGLKFCCLLTCGALGLVREAGKRLGFAWGSGRFRGCGCSLAMAATLARQNDQHHEDDANDKSKDRLGLHDQALHSGGLGANHTAF